MSNPERTSADPWRLPEYETSEDELWSRLGEEWQVVNGVHPDVQVYVRWQVRDGSYRLSGLCVIGEDVTTDVMRSIPVGRLANLPGLIATGMPREQFLRELAPLARRKEEDPDEFSQRVAWYYRAFSALSPRPAKDIADHSHVPVATVRGWIREARLRGKLPPGKKGKAG
ncbi:hypothetical protein [Nonomuraea jiangxiensis]|uniref:Uncharacterized protein n=1 Tax=Nonomuraea jiangxiensis TaxID=633440 RepID=A0A1G8XW96_9ACTN|nr:hypothetical protein [Nonomuraea jiangxiensis]SDJ94175.1 hypothetical protein SAMN05421869_11379 [Nonomuraea jiangxiensis]